jgi:hypothetical protein
MRISKISVRTLADAVSIGAITVLTTVLLSRYVLTSPRHSEPRAAPPTGLQPGATLNLRGLDFDRSAMTTVIVTRRGCAWTRVNAALYRELIAADNETRKTVVVTPDQPNDARSFLESLNVQPREMLQAPLGNLGLEGTPALILVDRMGRVKRSWIGALKPGEQNVLRRELGLREKAMAQADSEPTHDAAILSVEALRSKLATDRAIAVDIRNRREYAAGHIDASINIPTDELRSRAVHELPPDEPIVLVCGVCLTCEVSRVRERLNTLCNGAYEYLRGIGLDNVQIAMGSISELSTAGIRVAP